MDKYTFFKVIYFCSGGFRDDSYVFLLYRCGCPHYFCPVSSGFERDLFSAAFFLDFSSLSFAISCHVPYAIKVNITAHIAKFELY